MANQVRDIAEFIVGASGWVSVKTQGYVEATLHPSGSVDGRRAGKPWDAEQIIDFLEGEMRLVRNDLYRGFTRSMLVKDVDSGCSLDVRMSGSYTKGTTFEIVQMLQPA